MKKLFDDTLLCKNRKYFFCYKSGCIVLRDVATMNVVQTLRVHTWYKSFRLIECLLRYEPRVAVSLSDSEFLYSDHGFIYRYDVTKNDIVAEHHFDNGMNNPLNFCLRRDGEGKVKDLLYGEYFGNSQHGPVSIYKRIGQKWQKVYAFPSNTILHIHGIYDDQYRNRFLILTGDSDSESGI